MGLTWAVGWAVAGIAIGVSSILLPFLPWNAFFEVFDAPLPALAVPGFFAGMFFSVVLGIAARRRRFHELSLPQFAAWGAAGGLLLTLFPFALVALGLASREGSSVSTPQILSVITVPFVLLSAASASITLLVARRAERQDLLMTGLGVEADAITSSRSHVPRADRLQSPSPAETPTRCSSRSPPRPDVGP